MLITKSKFLAGTQCLKRLYWIVHSPEMAAQRDESDQSIIEQGRQVGLLAQQMFLGGVTVEGRDREEVIRMTRELIANPAVPAIFEGAFEHDDVFVRVDVLQRHQDQRWRLIEVKSTASVKDHHLADVAIQHRVVTGSGVDLAESCVAHVNRDYIYHGGLIDVHGLFKIKNLTQEIQGLQPEVGIQLQSEFRILTMSEAPQISAGRQCSDPYTCEFFEHCNPPLADDHILRLPRIHANTVAKLVALGVQSIHDIPESYPLTERLRHACTSVQMQKPWYGPELKDEVGKLTYPLYFMDFETINPCIPRFPGMRPYEQVPFQWSIHVQRQSDTTPEHFEFLADDTSDPRPAFISTLCDALGDSGSIVVYSQQFELQRLSELAFWLPEFSGRIKNIQGRLWDLLPLVRDHVYHPAFAGSFSLKSVLPALVPSMSYDDMTVADGQAAGLAWESLVQRGLDRIEHDRIRKALLAYCGQDTLGMVGIVRKLQHVAE
jgi:hypothetical protein